MMHQPRRQAAQDLGRRKHAADLPPRPCPTPSRQVAVWDLFSPSEASSATRATSVSGAPASPTLLFLAAASGTAAPSPGAQPPILLLAAPSGAPRRAPPPHACHRRHHITNLIIFIRVIRDNDWSPPQRCFTLSVTGALGNELPWDVHPTL